MNIIVLFSLYPNVIALPHLEYHVYLPSQKGSEGSSITIKSMEAVLYKEEQHRLGSIHLLEDVFVWISEVYNIKRSIEMVDRDWSSLTIQELGTSNETRRYIPNKRRGYLWKSLLGKAIHMQSLHGSRGAWKRETEERPMNN